MHCALPLGEFPLNLDYSNTNQVQSDGPSSPSKKLSKEVKKKVTRSPKKA